MGIWGFILIWSVTEKDSQIGSMVEASGFEIFQLNICQEASWWGFDAL